MSIQLPRRLALSLRVRPSVAFRSYSTTISPHRTTISSTYKRAPASTYTAPAGTTVGRGSSNAVENRPVTTQAQGVESYPEAQSESVPASLQPTASSAPATTQTNASSTPIDFTDSVAIDGSPNDPSSPDWSKSYFGLSTQPFPKEATDVLLASLDPKDVEIKPDGLIYLPEIKYRRVLNQAFGPGGWGLAPRSETNVGPRVVSREYALVCLGRLVGIARGEQEYFDSNGIPTATEACKSNALMRCCKDLGIASELWDPRFIREFKAKYCTEVFVEDSKNKKKRKFWRRKDQPPFEYPYKEC